MPSLHVWVQLYWKDEAKGTEEPAGDPIKIKPVPDDVADLKQMIKDNNLKEELRYTGITKVNVYPPKTCANRGRYKPGKKLLEVIDELKDTTPPTSDEHPLIVEAPAQQQKQQQRVVHDASLAEGVFVLYRGGDKDATPIGTAFAIASNLLLTACHNVVQKAEDGTFSEVTELKVALKLSRSSDSKIVADDTGRRLEISKYNTAVDWACLKLQGGEAPLTTIIPLGTQDSDLPKPATPEKLWIYHCPVQLFLDDQEVEVCHVMVKEASVGLVGKKILNFQNGAFPGSCGGPYIFRNKVVALHVDSVSTTKTAEDLNNEGGETRSGRKRKLTDTEITQKMVDSCVSSHTSLGSGIILNVRSGIMDLLNGQYEL